MASLIDHLWQSLLFALLIAALASLARRHGTLRLWMWRIAGLKFLVPFSLLHGLGGWIGFPVRHHAIPPPADLVAAAARIEPWFAPAQTFGLDRTASWILFTAGLLASALCFWRIRRQWSHAMTNAQESPPVGMWLSTTVAAVAFMALALPMLLGALEDRLHRQRVLRVDVGALRGAHITLTPIPSEFGGRPKILATESGVVIHHVNLQDLVAMVYGIGEFEVFGGALPWLEYPHYEVRVRGPVSAPEVFDAYALREPMTHYLNQEFGVSIRVNGNCQEPCVNQESFVVERIPWLLSKMISGEK